LFLVTQFVPAYRNRIWDGKIRLYNLQTSTLYRGLLKYVENFCESREYTFEYQDGVDVEDEFSLYHATKFADSLNIHIRGEPEKANEHQLAAFVHGMQITENVISFSNFFRQISYCLSSF
jgi:hypothetical protein